MIYPFSEIFEMMLKIYSGLGFDLCKHLSFNKVKKFYSNLYIDLISKYILFLKPKKAYFHPTHPYLTRP